MMNFGATTTTLREFLPDASNQSPEWYWYIIGMGLFLLLYSLFKKEKE